MAAVVEKDWETEVNKRLENYTCIQDVSLEDWNITLSLSNSITLKFYKPQKCSHRIGKFDSYVEESSTEDEKELWTAKTHNALVYNCIDKIEVVNDIIRIIFYSEDTNLEILSFWHPQGVAMKL